MTLTIHPSGLPDGAFGSPYDAALAGSGGHDPYDFSISQGALPPGIDLTGPILSGIPTGAGSFSFTVQMTDAALGITNKAYGLHILPLLPVITVEDGSIVSGANSYLSLQDLYEQQADLGTNPAGMLAFTALSPADQSNLIVWATAYIERRFRFYGQALERGQPLQWPRTKNYDIKGFPIPPGTVPLQLQQGVALLVTAAASNPAMANIENTAFPLRQQSWSMEGVSISYAPNTPLGSAASVSEGGVAPLFEQQLPDLQVLLRSIGELKDLSWVTTDRQTVVTR